MVPLITKIGQTKFSIIVFWTVVAVMVVHSGYSISTALFSPHYYHRLSNVSLNKAEFVVGEHLVLSVDVDRHMPVDCEVVIHRYVIRVSDDTVVWSQIQPGIVSNGINSVRRTANIGDLPPDYYLLRYDVINNCGSRIYRTPSPLLPFKIVP
jgi:hypothetical protein